MNWNGVRIAVVGGDEREQEISRLAATTGATVTAHGFPWPDSGIEGVELAPDAGTALSGAHYALFPIPGMAADGSLFAPAASVPVVPNAELLGRMDGEARILLGIADEGLRAAAEQCGVGIVEYEDDRELMLLRGPAIVEGAIAIAVQNTRVTIHQARVAVVGYGTIGAMLARTLQLLGAKVTVVARNPVQRAGAYALGVDAVPLEALSAEAEELAMVFSTVPAPVVGRTVLARLPRDSLVMDLAAPPGGVDLELARSLGHRAVWARGLGRRAPITVGASQWSGIRKRIEQLEEGAR